MKPVRLGSLAALTAAAGALFGASPAVAATNPFGCRASVGRGTLTTPLGGTLEPLVANPQTTPCASDQTVTQGTTVGSAATGGTLTLGPAGAFTYSTSQADPVEGLAAGAASFASTSDATLTTAEGTVHVTSTEARVAYGCVAGQQQASSSSQVSGLEINGSAVPLPPGGAPYQVPLGVDGSYVAVNQTVSAANSLTQRAVVVHLAALGDFVLAEATVTSSGSGACAAGTGVTPVPSLQPCPTGAVFNPVTQSCQTVGTLPVTVGNPFTGPTGGTVVPLTVARTLYKSPCLSGAGPDYVVVGTLGNDRIDGTLRADRILGLAGNDRLAGLGGNDCVDGGAGNDTLYDSNGNDRVYGATGNDRIAVGNGNDHVQGDAGNDRITAGNGRDVVLGATGNDRIDVGLGRDHVTGGAGNDRIYAAARNAQVDCGKGRNLAYVARPAAHYARRHGCQRVRFVR